MRTIDQVNYTRAWVLACSFGVFGYAQADSVLAPLVISDSANFTETYLAFKIRGKGIADAFSPRGKNPLDSAIHYYYIQKLDNDDKPVVHLKGLYEYASSGGCKVTNSSGNGSSWDVIVQTASQDHLKRNSNFLLNDQSRPSGWLRGGVFDSGPFYGMMIIDDTSNLASSDLSKDNGRRSGSEGDLSGFAYIVNASTGVMFDYKLLNNPLTKRSGDFKASIMSKRSIDWMWLPATGSLAKNQERTVWYTAVTGVGMSDKTEKIANNGLWSESVLFTQIDQLDTKSLYDLYAKNKVIATGAYNNDEEVLSGQRDFKIKCLGFYDRSSFLTPQQFHNTNSGGWKRAHIKPLSASNNVQVKTYGAITYRMDDVNGWFNASNPFASSVGVTFNVETSGHLMDVKNGQHPNLGL